MKKSLIVISIFLCLLNFCLVSVTVAQNFDISSGGQPTITGALNGSVMGSSSVLNNLSVTLNFGEISPANTNSIIKVVIPIAIRSNSPYQVTASLIGSGNTNPQAVQASDVGFGVRNMRPLGANARVCTHSSHIFYSPFNNDPTDNVTINSSGRITYQSTLVSIVSSTVIVSGPRLSSGNANRQTDNGYVFDAIFAITPQFFAPTGTTSATLTFTISSGPNVQC